MKIRLEKLKTVDEGYNITIDGEQSDFFVTRVWGIDHWHGGLKEPEWELRQLNGYQPIKRWEAPSTKEISDDDLARLGERTQAEVEAYHDNIIPETIIEWEGRAKAKAIKLTPEQLDGERTVRHLPIPMRTAE